jgi:hypothetical protein
LGGNEWTVDAKRRVNFTPLALCRSARQNKTNVQTEDGGGEINAYKIASDTRIERNWADPAVDGNI